MPPPLSWKLSSLWGRREGAGGGGSKCDKWNMFIVKFEISIFVQAQYRWGGLRWRQTFHIVKNEPNFYIFICYMRTSMYLLTPCSFMGHMNCRCRAGVLLKKVRLWILVFLRKIGARHIELTSHGKPNMNISCIELQCHFRTVYGGKSIPGIK